MFRERVWKVLFQEARNEGERNKWLAVSDGIEEYSTRTKRRKRGERCCFRVSSNNTHSARKFLAAR